MTSGADDALAAHELDLVTRAAQGDDAAFDRFFERNAAAVQLLVERLLGPGPAADAVVVEAFEKTVRRLPLLGARNSSPSLYVLSTARNGAYASLGKQRPAADAGPLGALLALPSRQRELLALRELGLPEADCAEVAGIDPGDVGVQVARARLRLTDELEGLTLSTVFADGRAERLLAAEVVRAEGAPLPEGVEREITAHADEDARFAAALSAVRSPSRSVGQLPAVTGAARLATAARSGSVGAARPASAAAATTAAAAVARAAAATPADASAATPVDPGVVSGPRAVPRSTSDPYDDQIGEEMAWGVVEDDDDAGSFTAPTAVAGTPAVEAPSDGQWEDGAGTVSQEPPAPAEPGAQHPPQPSGSHAASDHGEQGDPSLADPFAGWDDALDWGDDEKHWEAGSEIGAAGAVGVAGAAAAEAAHAAEAQPADVADAALEPGPSDAPATAPHGDAPAGASAPLEETRAFDAVAAGLVDPDPFPLPADGDPALEPLAERRSPWRWLIWAVALVLLFVGAAFVTIVIVNARQDPTLPPASTLDKTTPTKSTPKTPTPKASSSTKKSTSSSSSTKKKTTSTASTGSGGSAGSGTGSSSGTSSSGTSSTAGSSTGSAGKSSATSSGTTTKNKTGTTGATGPAPDDGQVVSGETNSGGAVRGTTP